MVKVRNEEREELDVSELFKRRKRPLFNHGGRGC